MSVQVGQSRRHVGMVWLIAAMCVVIGIPVAGAEWRSLKTEHFYVHFPAERAELATYVATRAEWVHDHLTARMGHAPLERTHIVLWQGTDLANAYATPQYENQIGLYLTFPSLADQYLAGFSPIFDDWITLLLIHEYTHILHLDMQSEAGQKLTSIFGRVPLLVSPLAVSPPFMLEGYAVYQESLDGTGRGSGSFYDMFLRTAVMADRLPRVDQVLGEYPLERWQPGGHVYFYGYAFLNYLAEAYGHQLLTQVNQELVKRPNSLGAALYTLTGRTLESLWTDWSSHVTERTQATLSDLALAPYSEIKVYDTVGYHALFPTPAPRAPWVAYIALGAAGSQLRIYDLSSGVERHLGALSGAMTTTIAWHPSEKQLVVTDMQEAASGFVVTHLVEVDIATGKRVRLAGTDHAFSPTFDPTGSRLAYIQRDGLDTHLRWLDRQTGRHHTVELPSGLQLLSATWAPTSDTLALSVWDPDRGTYLALLDLTSEVFTPVLGGGGATYDRPAWSSDGSTLLFASDRTGVFNLYAYNLQTERIRRLTHTPTGLFYPSLTSSDELVAMVYTADGYRLGRVVNPMHEPVASAWLPTPQRGTLAERPVHIEELGRYTPWSTLRPTFWLPSVGEGAGESQIRVLTAGGDVLGQMSYIATVGFSVTTGQPVYDVQWQQSLGEATGLSLIAHAQRAPGLLQVDAGWSSFDTRLASVGVEWRKPVERGLFVTWAAGTHAAAAGKDAAHEEFRTTTIEAGFTHQAYDSYFHWRSVRKLSVQGAVELGKEDAWEVSGVQGYQVSGPRGMGVRTQIEGGIAGEGRAVWLGAGGGGLAGRTSFGVRGYPELDYQARWVLKGVLQGSIPLVKIDRGFSDTPVFVKDVRLHPFVEGGLAKGFGAEPLVSALAFGAELGIRTYLGFGLTSVDLRVGIAQGLGESAHLYVGVGSNF